MLLAPSDGDGSIWRRVHFNYLLYFNAKKKQTVIVVVARNVADPIGAQEHVGMTHVNGLLAVLLLYCNYQSTEMCWTLTPHHVDTLHDFKWKTIRSFCCCNFPSNIPQTIIWISFLNRSESLRMQWSSKDTFILDIETWCTHFIGLYIATWYFKCSLSAHRFDLIAKAVCAIVLDQKSFMQSMAYARERTLFPWHFHWHKFSR